MLYISHTGCQWRFLPESFGPWTRVWSQFRRWSRSGTWAQALTVLHAAAREAEGRTGSTPSMVVIDTHLARGASNGGVTFHDATGWLQVACIATTLRHLSPGRAQERAMTLGE
jgi:putative transposase